MQTSQLASLYSTRSMSQTYTFQAIKPHSGTFRGIENPMASTYKTNVKRNALLTFQILTFYKYAELFISILLLTTKDQSKERKKVLYTFSKTKNIMTLQICMRAVLQK